MPDIVVPAYRYLMASGVPAALIAMGLLGKDAPGVGPYTTGWVFTGEQQGVPYREVENTGKAAIVLYSYDQWAAPTRRQQWAEFPILRLAIYADATRDALGNPTKKDGDDRARKVWDRVWPLFHDGRNIVRAFDTTRVISTVMDNPPAIIPMPSGDGAAMLTASFNVQI